MQMEDLQPSEKMPKKNSRKMKKKAFKKTNADTSAMHNIGMFSELGYIHDGGYTPVPTVLRQFKSKQMLGPGSKMRCGNQDGYFTRVFERIFEGEAYTDIIRMWRLTRKYLGPTTFYPPAYPKWSSGKGSHYGTFSGPIQHFSSQLKEGYKIETIQRNFYTSPGKKGTGYGYPGLAINNTRYKHMTDPYDVRAFAKWDLKNREIPFVAISPNRYFWPNPYKDESKASKTTKSQKELNIEPTNLPFFPPAAGKSLGGMKDGCFSSFPKREADPFIELATLKRYKDFRNNENKIFKYPEGSKSTRTNSSVKYNVNFKIHQNNFKGEETIFFKDICTHAGQHCIVKKFSRKQILYADND